MTGQHGVQNRAATTPGRVDVQRWPKLDLRDRTQAVVYAYQRGLAG